MPVPSWARVVEPAGAQTREGKRHLLLIPIAGAGLAWNGRGWVQDGVFLLGAWARSQVVGSEWRSPKPREQEDSDDPQEPNVCAPEGERDLCANRSPLILETALWCRRYHISDFTYGKDRGLEKISYFPS